MKNKLHLVEDVDNAFILLRCPDTDCGATISKSGKWLKENKTFFCPHCSRVVVNSDDDLGKLFLKHVDRLRDLHDQGMISIQ